MRKPKDILTPDDYTNYRNIRAISVLFIVFGSILVLGGIAMQANGQGPNVKDPVPPAAAVALALVGVCGVVGGIGVRLGSRKLAPVIYVMAAVYILGFPIGTILSYVLFKGLGQYLKSVDRLAAAK